MTDIALVDREPLRIAVVGTRIPRRAWSEVSELTGVLQEARDVLARAQEAASTIREQAYAEGLAAGTARAQALSARYMVEAQQAARDFVQSSQQRIVTLSLAILAHIAPRLGQGELVPALVLEALNAAATDQHLRVYVAPEAVATTQAALEQWQREHGRIDPPEVVADPNLEAFGCVVESELGRIEAGLTSQLENVRERLTTVAANS